MYACAILQELDWQIGMFSQFSIPVLAILMAIQVGFHSCSDVVDQNFANSRYNHDMDHVRNAVITLGMTHGMTHMNSC